MSMNPARLTETLGFVAAACTTLAFVPQIVKIRRRGGEGLSYGMLLLYLFGLGLWLVYGVRLHAAAVIVANAVGLVLVGSALLLKRGMERPRQFPPMEFLIPEVYACDNPLELVPAYPVNAEPEKVKALAYAANR